MTMNNTKFLCKYINSFGPAQRRKKLEKIISLPDRHIGKKYTNFLLKRFSEKTEDPPRISEWFPDRDKPQNQDDKNFVDEYLRLRLDEWYTDFAIFRIHRLVKSTERGWSYNKHIQNNIIKMLGYHQNLNVCSIKKIKGKECFFFK